MNVAKTTTERFKLLLFYAICLVEFFLTLILLLQIFNISASCILGLSMSLAY